MSKEREIVESLCSVIENGAGTPLTTTTRAVHVSKAKDRQVIVLPLALRRHALNAVESRWSLELLLILRSELVAANAGARQFGRAFDDVRVLVERIDAGEPFQAGGSLGIEKTLRGDAEYFQTPEGDAGSVAGATMALTVTWKE